jgi:predicted RNase H-like HicB family nuclease
MTHARRYAVVFERGAENYSAYVPDLPGCISVGATFDDIDRNIRDAIELYLDELARDGRPAPEPSTRVEYVNAHRA